jgi:hypothetical protein
MLVSLFPLLLCSCGSTHTIMVSQPRPATFADQIRIYYTAPRHFERIAIINSSSGPSWMFTTQGQADEAIAKLKGEAARLGANGILIESTGTSSSGNLGIGIGGFGASGDHHSAVAVSGETGAGGAILHRTAQATAIWVH